MYLLSKSTMLSTLTAPVSNSSATNIKEGQKNHKNKVLSMGFPMVENDCTSSGIVLVTPRGLQLPYLKENKTYMGNNQRMLYFFSTALYIVELSEWSPC